ncbi:hypothetical protein GCM10011574_31840 [Microbispora bryophytorum]|uniref:Uncharacterized protein n=1 Tax=Microbispora bryophytorum TaxID=1460882 RepID=A0A8H9H1B1_9ACTN|nr:hypothetical protein GCM10011574_31840 [Microbispora bryophytorum]
MPALVRPSAPSGEQKAPGWTLERTDGWGGRLVFLGVGFGADRVFFGFGADRAFIGFSLGGAGVWEATAATGVGAGVSLGIGVREELGV